MVVARVAELFQPITLRELTIRNRIWLSPMCQYSVDAEDGVPTDWHLVHLGSFAIGGFGLIITEATAVSPEGRISPQDTGLWNDDQQMAWRRITDFVHGRGAAVAVQLAHAGRKATTYRPWSARQGSVPVSDGGWPTVGPSAVAFGDLAVPHELTAAEIDQIVAAFAGAARRADAAGFDAIEVHAAHGYLLHQFLSPLANRRTDEYGGSFDNRVRPTLRVVEAIRAGWPDGKPVIVRISGTDWAPGGWTVEESAALAVLLADRGADLIDVSSGGSSPNAEIPFGPGYQVPLAQPLRANGVATASVGLITEPAQAEALLTDHHADAVLLARAALRDPAWPLRAAHELGVPADEAPYQPQYARAAWR